MPTYAIFKRAKAIPLPKTKTDLNDHCPISVLPVLTKPLEKHIYKHLSVLQGCRSPCQGPSAEQARRQHKQSHQYQHCDHLELAREHARTPDDTPPPSGDTNEYPALLRQQLPPKDTQQLQSQKITKTQGPPAATTPDSSKVTYATTGQILEGQRAPNNSSGMTKSDSGQPTIISADDNHHANADCAQQCFEYSGFAERRFHNGHGNYHTSCSQSPTNDPHLRTSEDPDDAQGTSPTVASPHGQALSACLSSAADEFQRSRPTHKTTVRPRPSKCRHPTSLLMTLKASPF